MLVAGIIVTWAPPASAHAVLLRTEPAPQTTVKTAPDAVRLMFSEPVEVTFGAVRVFDVDGTRVDPGTIERANGNRDVVVPVRLKNGTYTVTWRVTSADGHPVKGGFGFFVGTPSTISAVAVPLDAGAPAVVTIGYWLTRFLWLASVIAVVGMVAVRLWVWTPAVRASNLSGSVAADGFRRRFTRWLRLAWIVLVVAAGATLVFQAATVSGLSLAESARPAVLRDLLDTAFGRLWLVQTGLILAIGVPVFALTAPRAVASIRPPVWVGVLGVLAAGLCAATALNGHARTLDRASIMVPSLAVHIAAAALWVGGLAALVVLGGLSWRTVPDADRPALLRRLILRFGRLAFWAALVLAATGTLNTIGASGSLSDLWDTTYGRVVLAKVALLAVALALAARHRWQSPKRLAQPSSAGRAVSRFQRTSAVEVVVLTAAVGLAAVLVALVPGRSLALAAKGPVNQERRAGAYTVQLYIDPTTIGDNQVHVTYNNAQGLAAAEVTNVTVTLGPADGGAAPEPVEMRLISPGHFVGDTTLPAPGRYRLTADGGGASTTFDFRLHAKT
ncbi:MAG: copper resistance protein CopC [Acidimicrobiales bacterium]